jgi:hypothetical protein
MQKFSRTAAAAASSAFLFIFFLLSILLLPPLPARASSPPVLNQSCWSNTGGDWTTLNFNGCTPAFSANKGDLIVVLVAMTYNGNPVPSCPLRTVVSVTDSAGDVYRAAVAVSCANNVNSAYIYYAVASASGGLSVTISASNTGSNAYTYTADGVLDWSNVNPVLGTTGVVPGVFGTANSPCGSFLLCYSANDPVSFPKTNIVIVQALASVCGTNPGCTVGTGFTLQPSNTITYNLLAYAATTTNSTSNAPAICSTQTSSPYFSSCGKPFVNAVAVFGWQQSTVQFVTTTVIRYINLPSGASSTIVAGVNQFDVYATILWVLAFIIVAEWLLHTKSRGNAPEIMYVLVFVAVVIAAGLFAFPLWISVIASMLALMGMVWRGEPA